MKLFINYSNHNSSKWEEKQLMEAKKYGEICDMPFPMVDETASSEAIRNLAKEEARKILELEPACVMCQGEFTLVFNVINILKEHGVTVVAGCSKRISQEVGGAKISTFVFTQFREY